MGEDRYHRQTLIPDIGAQGRRRLADASVLLVGCGALGSVSADLLARAGIGRIRLVDRDIVELTNLQRQVLYAESDLGAPKATAARGRLGAVNSEIDIESFVEDVDASNIERLAEGCTVIIDGLDNFETRYLVNDLAVSTDRPWFYGGAVGTTGMSAVVIPGRTPCLRCTFPEPPAAGTSPTCDTAGVLGPVIHMVAAHQAMQAIKLLSGNTDAVDFRLHSFDAWGNTRHAMDHGLPRTDCPCCGEHDFPWLDGRRESSTSVLCGRDAVQIKPAAAGDSIELQALAERLAEHGDFHCSDEVLRGRLHEVDVELTVFADGRALIKGASTPEQARTVYARYIGT
ncbi:MAG: thiamine biosynthesis protein ThiF [Phycisphaerae bacterium]|nr:thiamine biosynthesis protein ThiF [Phycisphaerae bacterium]|tara:strand:- start:11739 stop:12764 length:1026 start_codon:yes stop_codon:yes gene_type:complete